MSDTPTPTEIATCQTVEAVIQVDAQTDIVVVNGVEVQVAAGSFLEGEPVVLLEGQTVDVLPNTVLPNPPVGEMLIQHKGLDVTNLVL